MAASSVVEVVAALNQPQYPANVEAAALVIRDHCAGDENVAALKRVAYVTAGAIPALVAAGTKHLNHAGVAEAVCRAFINLMYQNNANQVRLICISCCSVCHFFSLTLFMSV